MRQLDDSPLDPEVAAALDAIDATLAGDPVDPEHAELAELALLLTAERPKPSAAFAVALDDRVQRRFAQAPTPGGSGQPRRRARWWLWTPAAGVAIAVAAAIVIVVGGNGQSLNDASSSAGVPLSTASTAARSAAPKGHFGAPASASARSGAPAAQSLPGALTAKRAAAGAVAATPHASASPNSAPALAPATATGSSASGAVVGPVPNGRKIIQSAQLALSTNPSRIESVAQEVFVVVGQFHGIVSNSSVTAAGGPGAYAQFQLSIPSGSLPQAMASLSSLRFARVLSRTDTTQDVNDQYQADVNRVGADRAIRASLLKQLADAVTQGEIDSLTIRIHDIDAAISSDQATLRSLTNQIDYSRVTVTINDGYVPTPLVHTQSGSGGFTLGQAAHDAGRVLTVAAGVALIGLAALAPIALLVALGWWIAAAIRRRRREQALDLV